jgi:hypothetical protein
MSDREIQVPEVEGKTIRSMRLTLTSSAETEIQIDFTDGTSFTSVSVRSAPLAANRV